MTPLALAPNLIERVYERLLEAIADHTLPPGRRIRQHELAASLGVSRQPVSHALHLLHRQGLVSETGRKGFIVTLLEPTRIRQLYEIRAALDGLACALAARRAPADAAGRAALTEALAAGGALDGQSPLPLLIARDVGFHQALYRLSGNPAIEEMVAPHWPHMRRSMAAVLSAPDYRASAWAEHAAIARLVLAGDAEGAEAAARDHALTAGRTTEERLAASRRAA